MTRKELIEDVSRKTEQPKARVAEVIAAAIDTVGAALVREERVQIHGLGVFETRMRAAKVGRNPATGESVTVPAQRVVKFRPAQDLRDRVAQA